MSELVVCSCYLFHFRTVQICMFRKHQNARMHVFTEIRYSLYTEPRTRKNILARA